MNKCPNEKVKIFLGSNQPKDVDLIRSLDLEPLNGESQDRES